MHKRTKREGKILKIIRYLVTSKKGERKEGNEDKPLTWLTPYKNKKSLST